MNLYEQSGDLRLKMLRGGLSLPESVRLRSIDEQIDLEEEDMLVPLEAHLASLEALSKTITECVECLRSRTT